MSALWPVQEAAVARLEVDAALMAEITGVFDGEAWQDTAMPYVVVGSGTEVGANVFGRTGWSDTLMIHVFARGGTARSKALQVLGLIDAALTDPLAINGHQTARLRRRTEITEVLTEEGGVRHVPARYRVTTRETA